MANNAKAVVACATAIVLSSMLSAPDRANAAVPAFPGAQGPGATATGGRGGDVYHVTNLNPDKAGTVPGSLQYGINNAPSAGRTIVFDVGGTIYLAGQSANDTLRYGDGNITIAGQTAPGPGITIAGTGTKWTGTNVILRNISIRPNKAPVTYDAFSLQVKNSIIDHVTATWFTDEGISITDAGETTTVQYANISEGLNYAGHSFGSIITTERDGTHYSFNHNLYAHNASRMPRVGAEIGQTGAVLEFSNNVIYNWASTKVGYGGENQPGSTNFINNYYVKGYNNNTENLFVGDDDPENSGVTKVHESGNKLDGNRNGVLDGKVVSGRTYFRGGLTLYSQPFNVSGVSARDTADVALQRVLDYGGANWQNRNPIDARIMNSVRSGAGQGIADLSGGAQASEWATLMAQRPNAQGIAPFVRLADFDTDRDGMSDVWEAAHGLNPAVAGNNADFDSDGYTNLEEYINDLGAWPSGKTLVFNNGNANGRYAQIGNWGNLWQPSRYDAAQINAGTVTIDAVGQTARTLAIASAGGDTAALHVTGGWIDVRETLSVGPGGAGTVSHAGGLLRAGTAVVVGGTKFAGTYNLSGGTLATALLTMGTMGGTFNFTGGVLRADEVDFGFTNNGGIIAPGSDALLQAIAAASMKDIAGNTETVRPFVGTTRITGDLTLASGLLQIDLASPTSSDKLIVEGALALGGNLGIVLNNEYTPTPGTQWLIASATGGITGEFESVTPGFSLRASGNSLFLAASQVPEPGSPALAALACAAFLGRRRLC